MFFDLHFSKLVTLCNARIIKKEKEKKSYSALGACFENWPRCEKGKKHC